MRAWLVATLLVGAALPCEAQRDPRASEVGCVVCHGEQARLHAGGLHARANIGCSDCHGGDPSQLEAASAHGDALAALREPSQAVATCGGCHADVARMRLYGLRTDQLSLFATSDHGRALKEKADVEVATCVSCHGSHLVLAPTDTRSPIHPYNQVETCGGCHADTERMARHGLGADTVARYRRSVHGRALLEEGHPAAPACTDCHGSHGAAPPRVLEIETVCGHCHSVVQDYFEEGAHFGGVGSTVQCASCHGNHDVQAPSRAMFLGDAEGHCGSCHDPEVGTAMGVAARLHDDLSRFEARIHEAEAAVREASGRGLFLGNEAGYLGDARSLLVRARALTHTLSTAALDDALNRGEAMVATAMENLHMKQRGLRDRRIFTGLFFAVSLAFAIALVLYAREIRGRTKDAPARPGAGGRDVA